MISCPPVDKWHQYLQDRLTRTENGLLTEHLEACPACEETLGGLVAPCGPARVKTADSSPPVPELVANLRRLWSAAFPPADRQAPEFWPTIEGYHILGVLGRGGLGIVYRAVQEDLGREVALKMLAGGEWSSAADARCLLHDAQTAAQLTHDHIVPIYAVGQHLGLPYCVMKWIEGGSLAERVADLVLEPRQVTRLVAAAARALHYAHQHGVCHRDVKPGNILLQVRPRHPASDASNSTLGSLRPRLADLDACVSDFGLARRMQEEAGLTQSGTVRGTPGYMAPEQIRSEKPSPAADIYSLGAVLYECLTGQAPARAATAFDTLLMTLHKEPERPRVLNSRLSRDLETVCLKCLEKEPQRRYTSAADLAADLERWLRGEPVRARRVGPGGRAWRWCRRKPLIAGLAAALLVAVAGGLLASLLLWRQAVQNKDRAVLREAQALASLRNEETARRELEEKSAKLRDMLHTTIQPGRTRPISLQGMDPHREALLVRAELQLSDMLRNSARDDELRELLATVLTQLGAIRVRQNHDGRAQEFLERAAALWESLPREQARAPEDRAWLAITFACLEQIYERQGQADRAQRAFESAISVWLGLVRELPGTPPGFVLVDADLDIGWALITLGTSDRGVPQRIVQVRDRLSRLAEAPARDLFFDLVRVGYWHGEADNPYPSGEQTRVLANLREAVAILQRLLPQVNLPRNTRCRLACSALLVSKDLRRHGSSEEALRLSEQARGTLQELLQESPQERGLVDALGQAWNEIAKDHWDLNQTEETLTACRNAVEMQRRVCALAHGGLDSKRDLAWRYCQLGRKLCELGRLDEAEACFRERQAQWPTDADPQVEAADELRKWAAQLGNEKDHLTPSQQLERQRYLELGERLERQGGTNPPAVQSAKR